MMNPIRWTQSFAALLLAASIAACGGGGGGSADTPAATTPPETATAVLGTSQTVADKGVVTGTVREPGGTPVGGATVTLDGVSAVSNGQGFFVLERAVPGADRTLLLDKAGYMSGNQQVDVVGGAQSHLDLVIRRVGTIRTGLSGTTVATVADARSDGRNGQVSIPANAVVDAAGRPVANYSVELTTLLPSDPGYTAAFPGRFLGGAAAGSTANPVPLQSFGVIDVVLKDAQGNRLQLAPGALATLTFPLDASASHDPGTPTVPLWYLDTATGIWVQEGVATRTGTTYVAQVAHFTPWNLDRPFADSAIKEVRVKGLGDVPVSDARVIVEGTGYRQIANTGENGVAVLTVRPGDVIRVTAYKGTLSSSTITETAPSAGQRLVNVVDLVEPLATAMLTWSNTPSDLDSHMTGPTGLHVYYQARGNATTSPYAKLDTDDVDGYGPEIVTLTRLEAGTYRFSVHNYSGQSNGPIQSSQAVVNLVVPRTGVIRRYDVPTLNPANGNLWVVFELDVNAAGSVVVRDVSEFRSTTSPQAVP